MRTFLAMAMAASLFVAVGCSCATGDCNPCEVIDDCATCVEVAAPVCETPVVAYAPPAPVVVAAPVVVPAPAPVAVAPVTCNPCAGL